MSSPAAAVNGVDLAAIGALAGSSVRSAEEALPPILVASDELRGAPPGTAAARVAAGVLAEGWSVIWLPPRVLPEAGARRWLAGVAAVVREAARHGLARVVLFDESEPRERRVLVRSALGDAVAPVDVLLADIDRDADAVLAALRRHRVVEDVADV